MDHNELLHVRKIKGHPCELPQDDDLIALYINDGVFINFRRKFRKFLMVSSSNPESKRTLKSTAQIRMEEAKHLHYYYHMIHPFSNGRILWEMVMIVVLFLLFVLMPIECVMPVAPTYILYTKFALDIVSFIDIILFFITGYYDNRIQHVVMDRKKVIKHYLRTYFLTDLISSQPVNMIITMSGQTNTVYFRIKYIFILKLIRLPTLIKYVKNFCERKEIYSYNLSAFNFLLIYFILIWWASAATFIILTVNNVWEYYYESRKYILTDLLDCAYQVVKMFLLIGVKDVDVEDISRMVFSNVCLLLGSVMGMVIFAQVMQTYNRHSRAKSKYNDLMQQIAEYMKYKELPPKLREKILHYVDFRFQKQIIREADILNTLSTILKKDILMHTCKKMLEKVEFFKKLPMSVILRIVVKLRSEIYLPNDTIVQAGSSGNSMYFIFTGTVAVYTSLGKEICHLNDGSHFGEISLVINEPRVATVIAIKDCELFRLNRRDFQEALDPYPNLRERIKLIALSRLKNTMRVMDKFDPN